MNSANGKVQCNRDLGILFGFGPDPLVSVKGNVNSTAYKDFVVAA